MTDWSTIGLILILSMQAARGDIAIDLGGNVFFSSQYLISNDFAVEDKVDVEKLVAKIIRQYTDAGFPFCRIYPEVIREDDVITKIILKIDEGERITISDYLFDVRGSTGTKALRKIAGLKTDRYFSSKEIEYAKRNLLKTEVFEAVEDNIICRDGDYYVMLSLREKKDDYLAAYGSLEEDNFNFSVSFYTLNLLGTLRRLRFHYEHQKLFSLEFAEPILIHPAVLNGVFSLWTYDSVRLLEFSGRLTTPLGQHFTVSLISGVEAVSYYNSDSARHPHTDNMVGIGFGVDYESFNWAYQHEACVEYLFRQYDRWQVQYDGKINIMGFNLRPHYYHVETDSFEYFDFYHIGGAKNLRGYLEEEFSTSDAVWLNIEYKRFFVFPLLDIGLLQDDLKLSYGFGVEAGSDFANTSLVIAWPKKGTWRDGKIHLMLEAGF